MASSSANPIDSNHRIVARTSRTAYIGEILFTHFAALIISPLNRPAPAAPQGSPWPRLPSAAAFTLPR
jgi:hypothetical protein